MNAMPTAAIPIAAKYLKCRPRIYSYGLSWNFPSKSDDNPLYEAVQTFHRDQDDFRFLSLFVFLSGSNGDHVYAPGTQSVPGTRRFLERLTESSGDDIPPSHPVELSHLYHDRMSHIACSSGDPELYERVTPAPGRAFLVDPSGLHRGEPPVEPSLMLQVRFGLFSNVAHHQSISEKIPWKEFADRVGDTPETRYMYELIADFKDRRV